MLLATRSRFSLRRHSECPHLAAPISALFSNIALRFLSLLLLIQIDPSSNCPMSPKGQSRGRHRLSSLLLA
ncbi:hypothetical protein MARPO_0058s0065 [Marchantia polymorpha]|uniref:Uncharacterized protein n=1 Tax=Marchantia polymorpha TaxID=3197 RepID=A0A2R6WTX0_MARPO|nr:hypothetical protein MARPO_0058s0065 [Marchantia polymorpha]|eukprot:PTQ37279.1 hypothetical protein MARPO_0058s0065 [Marchantia polymorpha]